MWWLTPAIDGGQEPVFNRPFDIAEQDDPIYVGRILGAVNEGLVET